MSYQSTKGLEWQGIGYGKQQWYALPGVEGLGAVTQTPHFNYRAAAEPLAKASLAKTPSASRVVITLEADGRSPVVMPFSDNGLAGKAMDDVVAAPGTKVAYVSIWGRDGVVAEQHFGVSEHIETRFTFDKLKNLAPVLIGGALLIAGAVYLSRGEKRGKGKAKRRARSYLPFRRRTVTVWR